VAVHRRQVPARTWPLPTARPSAQAAIWLKLHQQRGDKASHALFTRMPEEAKKFFRKRLGHALCHVDKHLRHDTDGQEFSCGATCSRCRTGERVDVGFVSFGKCSLIASASARARIARGMKAEGLLSSRSVARPIVQKDGGRAISSALLFARA